MAKKTAYELPYYRYYTIDGYRMIIHNKLIINSTQIVYEYPTEYFINMWITPRQKYTIKK